MDLFGWSLELRRKAPPAGLAPARGRGGWYPIIREPYTGAWQQNAEQRVDTAIQNPTVFTCATKIAGDIAKMRLRLVEQTAEGIWRETTNPAYSPLLRKPNHYQITPKFLEQWILSKLRAGNAYALKERDARGVVRALYVLDPLKVTPLVAPDGAVYYQLNAEDRDLTGAIGSGLPAVPASEIIHDPMYVLFHPLCGLPPLFACGAAALQAGTIADQSIRFFANGSQPGGVLTAPGAISDDTAKRLADYWDQNYTGQNVGKVAVLGDGLKYEQMTIPAAESQLIEQLQLTAETICQCFHIPAELVLRNESAHAWTPEQLTQLYYTECLQPIVVNLETCLDDGLELATTLGVELDVDDLIWMDTATKTKAAETSIGAGALSPDEARAKYYGLGKVKGGDTPYMQQQNFSLAALAERDADQPFAKAAAPTPATPANPDESAAPAQQLEAAAFLVALTKQIEGLYAS